MSDRPAQQEFALQLFRWGNEAYDRGYRCTFGDFFRDPRATFPYARPGGFHSRRLAADINLFRGDASSPIEDRDGWVEMGHLWVQLGGTWGGDFRTGSVGDANHLSWGEGPR